MSSFPPGPSDPSVPTATPPRPHHPRWLAAIEVFAVCGIPTAVIAFGALVLAGRGMGEDGALLVADPRHISLEFFAMSSLIDTALIALLIRLFLAISGEHSRDVFIGPRPVSGEVLRGLLYIPLLLLLVIGVTQFFKVWLPGLRNVPTNPFEAYMNTPLRAAVFIVVTTLAGGVREELQRAFILHRFDQRLGGIWVGLAVWSLAFGVLHVNQGYDVAIAVGVLGFVWGLIYVRRRSAVAAMVSHAGFNALQVVASQFLPK